VQSYPHFGTNEYTIFHISNSLATGRVYVWGSSGTSAATLGLGDRVTVVKSPTLIGSLSDKQIRRIYCGKSSCFSFALTMHGDMYAFGQNTSAQLGFGDFVTRSRPEKCNKISRVAVMTTSLSSVVCVNTEGLMFTWGGNSGSLFQIGSTRGNVIIPTEIPIARGKDIIQVDCTWDTVIALSRGGDIYTWGKHKDVLKQLFSNIPLRSLSCGKNHVLAEAKSGEFYGWTTNDETVVPKRGYNETGLTKMDLKNTFKLVAGDRFTFALSDEDTI
jgi:alpha-tubulin suppressor-like RCC1 family protein